MAVNGLNVLITMQDFASCARSVPGVAYVSVLENTRGIGTLEVHALGHWLNKPKPEVLAAVQAVLEANSPVGIVEIYVCRSDLEWGERLQMVWAAAMAWLKRKW